MYNRKERDLFFYSAMSSLAAKASAAGVLPPDGLRSECRLTVETRRCRLDESLFAGIESRIPHIIGAVDEMRSLISSEGEVVRIDQAKRPTGESVRHLARHCELFGSDSFDDDRSPLPENIYIVDNTDNYAVYENRFLFALLSFLRDFLSKLCRGIEHEISGEYVEMTVISREKTENGESMRRSVFTERGGMLNIYSEEASPTERISLLVGTLSTLLSGVLMTEVSKAPLLRPPFVRTNIIKNNVNFAVAFELFDLVSSYKGVGYTTETDKREFTVPDEVGRMLDCIYAGERLAAEASAFGLLDVLAESRRTRMEEEVREAVERRRKELARLRAEMESKNASPEDYILLLEKQLSDLESEGEAKSRSLEASEKQLADCRMALADSAKEIERAKAHADECGMKLHLAYDECEKRISVINREFDDRLELAKKQTALAVAKAREEWSDERNLLLGTIKAGRLESGETVGADDYASRDSFVILEKEFSAMKKYYRSQWKLARADIRRRERKQAKAEERRGKQDGPEEK